MNRLSADRPSRRDPQERGRDLNRMALAVLFAVLATFGVAACSDEDGDGETTDEETEQIENDLEDGADEVEQQIDEGAEEGDEGEG